MKADLICPFPSNPINSVAPAPSFPIIPGVDETAAAAGAVPTGGILPGAAPAEEGHNGLAAGADPEAIELTAAIFANLFDASAYIRAIERTLFVDDAAADLDADPLIAFFTVSFTVSLTPSAGADDGASTRFMTIDIIRDEGDLE